ncbi:putative ribonuclease H-like domain-containing protein [Tanacetum coccineum]|uniref:Ribonuclease H-like domain-containing protein n=1 Tax=Tanacetum coccineum TaxID=301880 RepID=A0ABQ5FIN5_9ASTR
MNFSPIPTTRIDKDHPKDQIIRDLNSAIQTRRMTKIFDEHAMRAIGTKWVFRNKKDKRGIVIRNKARLVAQGYTQEEGINYDEVFAHVARIKAIRLFLAYASFIGFIVYQMDVKSAFLYGTIEEEVYVCQSPGFEDPQFPDKVYKVEKALYGLHQALRAWYETLFTYLIENGFRRGTIDKTLSIMKDKGDILLVHVYVDDIIFRSTKKSLCDEFKASTLMEPNKALVKDEEADSVDVHLYRSMIGSLMYLTTSRPDITFAICACARFQVTPKTSHLHAVKRIFRYLKDSDYAGASLDRKSIIGGEVFKDGFDGCIGLKMLFGPVLRVKHGKKLLVLPGLLYAAGKNGMLRNLDPKKFLMYPRFLQLFLDIQLLNLVIPFNDIHETPKLTKKVFTNVRKPGKGFSGRVTPLFQNILAPPIVVGEGSEQPLEPQPTPSTTPLEELSQVTTAAASQPPKDPNTYRRTKRGRNTKVPQSGGSPNKVGDEAINEEILDSVERASTTATSLEAE